LNFYSISHINPLLHNRKQKIIATNALSPKLTRSAKKNVVATAKAGAYVRWMGRLTDVIGPCLRWGDDENYGDVVDGALSS
jgi:hypothetical protein